MSTEFEEYFARELNTDPEIIEQADRILRDITKKEGILKNFYENSQDKLNLALRSLNLTYPSAETLYSALKEKIIELNQAIFEVLKRPNCNTQEGCRILVNTTLDFHFEKQGFFLKKETAMKLLEKNPPLNILKTLGYGSVSEMLKKEDITEVYAALRFVEDREWLNEKYLTAYGELTEDDFEIRPIEIRVLEKKKWATAEEAFIHKKLHPMSHLKEMGVVLVLPTDHVRREVLTLYLFAMMSHYLDEITLYSKYFQTNSNKEDFGKKIVSAIRGDVPTIEVRKDNPNIWLLIQRYLFKDNPDDPRLKVPHVNPEALYHRAASYSFYKLKEALPHVNLTVWEHTNYIGEFFPTASNEDELVTCNLMDNIMNVLNKEDFKNRYLYHFREALWNKIFLEYFGVRRLEETVIDNLESGFFDLRKI